VIGTSFNVKALCFGPGPGSGPLKKQKGRNPFHVDGKLGQLADRAGVNVDGLRQGGNLTQSDFSFQNLTVGAS